MAHARHAVPKAKKNATDGRWRIQVDVGRTPDGKRKRKVFTGKTKAAAEARAREYITSHPILSAAPSGRTVETYLREWITSKHANWKPRTQELYQHQIQTHIVPAIGSTPLEDLKPLDVQRMLNGIVSNGKISTANKVRRLLFSAMKQAVRWELVPNNPVEAVDPIKEQPAERALWTPAQTRLFLDSVKPHRLGALFVLMTATGLRRGEALGLRWSDVKDTGVRIEQTVVLVHDKVTFSTPKTRRDRRFIRLDSGTLDMLRDHRQRQAAEREACGAAWSDHDLVFPTQIGTPIHPRNLYRVFKAHITQAGLPRIRLHDLWHLNASLLIAAGVDAKNISDRLGHASTAFTLDRYGHIFNEHRERSALSIESLLGDSASTSREETHDSDDANPSL